MTTAHDDRAERFRARKEAQERNLFGRLSAAALASRTQAKRLLKSVGTLSITEWRILWDLAEAGPLTVTEMASIQRSDHALVSRTIPAMVEKGYVTAAPGAWDRRTSLVTLTPAGQSAFDAASTIMSRRREALSGAFPDGELDRFLALIDRFERFVEDPVPSTPDIEGTG